MIIYYLTDCNMIVIKGGDKTFCRTKICLAQWGELGSIVMYAGIALLDGGLLRLKIAREEGSFD